MPADSQPPARALEDFCGSWASHGYAYGHAGGKLLAFHINDGPSELLRGDTPEELDAEIRKDLAGREGRS